VRCKKLSDRAGWFANLRAPRIKNSDLMQLFIHLEQLLEAGVPLLKSLSEVRGTTGSPRLRDILLDMYHDIGQGDPFSGALLRHPAIFDPLMIAVIEAGEKTGSLTGAFQHIVQYLKWHDSLQSQISKATRYPKILAVAVCVTTWVMMEGVVPQVAKFVKENGKALPPVTTDLIATSAFLGAYSGYIAGGACLLYIIVRAGCALSEQFRYLMDYIALNIPVIGAVIRKICLLQFCQTFAVLFSAGLDLLKCLEAAGKTTSNGVIIKALELVRQRVQEGLPLSEALNVSGQFPSLVVQMVKTGEETGKLGTVLEKVVYFYDKDVNEAVEGMISLIEPTLTVVMGAIVLWVAVAVFGPVYDSLVTLFGH
jgi:type IV pilus assembly protein PilC